MSDEDWRAALRAAESDPSHAAGARLVIARRRAESLSDPWRQLDAALREANRYSKRVLAVAVPQRRKAPLPASKLLPEILSLARLATKDKGDRCRWRRGDLLSRDARGNVGIRHSDLTPRPFVFMFVDYSLGLVAIAAKSGSLRTKPKDFWPGLAGYSGDNESRESFWKACRAWARTPAPDRLWFTLVEALEVETLWKGR